ncbi:exo-beta-1,3-glucanase [Clavulina sp. PMI_390]|nr:exo-beta-1,3-glucanase [Clavulina sp. PMI_390]
MLSALLFLTPALVAPVHAINLRFPYGDEKVRGVNLGGWLVMEPWITPSMFEAAGSAAIDEWTYGQAAQDNASLKTKLKTHWNTWITESDIAAIAAAGLNHVRIPIGYWAFDTSAGEPYISGQYPYLLKAIQWCSDYDVKVLIDLHGVPGSQNGFDNSGRRGTLTWPNLQSNIDRTNAIITQLAHEFSQSKYASTVVSIAPINEPASFKSSSVMPAVKSLYSTSYASIRRPFKKTNTQGDLLMLIHDAFQNLTTYWQGYMTPDQNAGSGLGNYAGVAIDSHSYSVFSTGELEMSDAERFAVKCQLGNEVKAFSNANIWSIIGEWTVASTDCAKYLNGRGIGARYDGSYSGSTYIGSCTGKTGSASSFSSTYKVFLRKNFEAQTTAYERGQGWIFWTWKAESADDWSYQAGIKGGWIPATNPAEKKYGNICGY